MFLASAAVAVVMMAYASVCDFRYREVRDLPWWAMALTGAVVIPCMAVRDGAGMIPAVSSIYALVVFGCLAEDRHPVIPAVVSVMFPVWAFLTGSDTWVLQVSLSPVFVSVFYALYVIGMVPGGADAKCLMSLSILFPAVFGPISSGYADVGIAEVVFPPAMKILLLSCIITIVAGGAWILYKGRGLAHLISADYRIPLEEAGRSFVWALEDVSEGEVIRIPRSDDIEGACRRLRGIGRTDILVSPMFPFIIPMAVSLVYLLVAGCPFIS